MRCAQQEEKTAEPQRDGREGIAYRRIEIVPALGGGIAQLGERLKASDLLCHGLGAHGLEDTMAAVESQGIARMRAVVPLSNRLLREVHGILLAEGRESGKDPGNFRGSQNWIEGARRGVATFVPPPANQVEPCMGDLESFMHDKPTRTPSLIRAARAHVKFETIHPFLG